jgi:hypothetical protein
MTCSYRCRAWSWLPSSPSSTPRLTIALGAYFWWATLRNTAISLLRIAGITQIARTLQAFARDRTRILDVIPL